MLVRSHAQGSANRPRMCHWGMALLELRHLDRKRHGSGRMGRANSLVGSLPGCIVDKGCKRPPDEVRKGLLLGRTGQLEEEGSSCHSDMALEVDRSRQCRVVGQDSHGRTRQVCMVRCIHHRGLFLVSVLVSKRVRPPIRTFSFCAVRTLALPVLVICIGAGTYSTSA